MQRCKATCDNPELVLLNTGDRELSINLQIKILITITIINIIVIITITNLIVIIEITIINIIKIQALPPVVSICASVVRPGLGTLPATIRSRNAEDCGPLSSNLAGKQHWVRARINMWLLLASIFD